MHIQLRGVGVDEDALINIHIRVLAPCCGASEHAKHSASPSCLYQLTFHSTNLSIYINLSNYLSIYMYASIFMYLQYIYVVRSGKDVLGSFYHHLSNQDEESGGTGAAFPSFEEFTQQWLQGSLPYGKWTEHVYSWINRTSHGSSGSGSSDCSVLVVRYEDMLEDLCGSLEKIAAFLCVSIDSEALGGLATSLSFEGMRAEREKYEPVSVQWKNDFRFLRKGVKGDSASLFDGADEALLRRYDDAMRAQIGNIRDRVTGDGDTKALELISSLAE